MTKNLDEIGISRDPNEILTSSKQKRLQMVKLANGLVEDIVDEQKPVRPQSKVVEQMEHDANEYRESQFRYMTFHYTKICRSMPIVSEMNHLQASERSCQICQLFIGHVRPKLQSNG